MYYVVLNGAITGKGGYGVSPENYFYDLNEAIAFADKTLANHGGFVAVWEGDQEVGCKKQKKVYSASKI